MKNCAALLTASLLLLAVPAFAQRPEDRRPDEQKSEQKHDEHGPNAPRANHGRIPDPPQRRESRSAPPEQDRRQSGHVNNLPHVNNDHWYGHDKPNDKRYHVDHPFEHGHFEHFGQSYRYKVERFDPDRHVFWFPGGFSFQIASWDWAVAADWCWNCDSDDFVVYEDPDHDGWYLLYNIHTGGYVHVIYMGS